METKDTKILIAGASGMVGSALIPALESEGAEITRLVRSTPRPGEIEWHPSDEQIDVTKLEGFDAVINLAGENIAEGRWTDEQKRKIHDSRVKGTRLLSEAIAKLNQRPKVYLGGSATGIYGNRGDEILTEDSKPGSGFLAGVCHEWEQATQPASAAGVRVVTLRFGPILAREGGMMAKLLTPFKMGVGGKVGSGKQYISWVAIDDVVTAMKLALTDESISGPLNIVSPDPVTNEEFTRALGQALSRPTVLAMPAFAARLAFGEMADEMLLASQRVEPRKLESKGFQFKYPQIGAALQHLLA